ncbi:branched-chain amino acid ABC transporter permease [Tardiphaga sp. 866_E4_N2_1]|uniref:branched-chain amino acid ABC transporter permease n=1 Tax=unclassified Tardiphaga TaxID=2631404 RepID=UPI003F216C6A
MNLFDQLLTNGIVIGGTYALIAIGLTLIFGMMRVVNFAHGEFYMLGGYIAVWAAATLNLSLFIVIPLAMLSVAIVGFAFEWLLLRRLRGADLLSTAILTLGLSIAMQNIVLQIWGPKPAQIPDPFSGRVLSIWGIEVTALRVFTLLTAALIILILAVVMKYSKVGRTMRATFQARESAALQGIDVNRVFGLVFAIGVGLAAAAGAMLSAVFVVSTDMGSLANLKSFAVVILGGLGNIPGAIVGGFLLGIAESLAAGYISTGYKDGVSFLILILALLVRPHGLFGREEIDG